MHLGKWCQNLKFPSNPRWWTHPTTNPSSHTTNHTNRITNHTLLHHITTLTNQYTTTLTTCLTLTHHHHHSTTPIITIHTTIHLQVSSHTILIIVSNNHMEDIMDIWVEVWVVVQGIDGEGCNDFYRLWEKNYVKFKTVKVSNHIDIFILTCFFFVNSFMWLFS